MNRKRNKGKHEGGQLTEHGCGRNKQQNANRTAKFGSAENGNLQLSEIRLDAKKIKRIDRPPCLGDFDTNIVTLIDGEGMKELPMMTKREVADGILDRVAELRAQNN